jgi:hypothetical protein
LRLFTTVYDARPFAAELHLIGPRPLMCAGRVSKTEPFSPLLSGPRGIPLVRIKRHQEPRLQPPARGFVGAGVFVCQGGRGRDAKGRAQHGPTSITYRLRAARRATQERHDVSALRLPLAAVALRAVHEVYQAEGVDKLSRPSTAAPCRPGARAGMPEVISVSYGCSLGV